MSASNNSAGLAGVTAGKTAICTVGKQGVGLTYRGYTIEDLAERAEFEEVAYLMFYGELPTRSQLTDYKQRLAARRGLPEPVKAALELLPANTQPMDVMRTGASVLGTLEQENDAASQQHDVADRLLAVFPSMLLYWYHFAQSGRRIEVETDDDGTGAHFLHLLHGEPPGADARKAMSTSLILYAEHEFNASTFTARVITATLSDFYSAVVGAIGALRGPLPGGANEQAMALIESFADPDAAEAGLKRMLANKEKVMGFGHRVYKNGDSRVPTMKKALDAMIAHFGRDEILGLYDGLEAAMAEAKDIKPNLDYPAGPTYHLMGFDTQMFTPLFIASRISGWTAHIMEQRANNALIRPLSAYNGPDQREL